MANNPYKSFIAVGIPSSLIKRIAVTDVADLMELGDEHETADPEASQWSRAGLVQGDEGYFQDLNGAAHLIHVRFNERILPASVRDEHLKKRVAELEHRQGHKINKKDFAQLKDEVVHDLLPKAFIKRSTVPVMFVRSFGTSHDLLLVFTSSAKRYEDAMAVLRGLFNGWDEFQPWLLVPNGSIVDALTRIAKDAIGPVEIHFKAGNAAVLKGEGKRTIRIKGREIEGCEVQELLNDGYDVHELQMAFYGPGGDLDDEDPTLSLTMNDKLIFKRVVFADHYLTGKIEDPSDVHAQAWLVATEYRSLVTRMFAEFGGIKPRQENAKTNGTEKPATTPADEDDEL